MIYLYGYHAVQALLEKHPELIEGLYADMMRDDHRFAEVKQSAQMLGLRIEKQSRKELALLCASEDHQGIVASISALPSYSDLDLMELIAKAEGPLLFLVLDGVQDPHNLGACLRTANAMGVHAVIAPKDRAVGLTPTVMKVASGAAIITPLVTVTNLSRTIRDMQEKNIWFIGADAKAETHLSAIDMTGSVAIIMGSEGQGMRRLTRDCCDYLAAIPLKGTVSSLNVSVATGIILYEVVRQRGR